MTASVEIVRELDGFNGRACLVKRDEEHFVVSSVNAFLGPETLVFPCDEHGEISSWIEVAGGQNVSRDEAIAELGER